MRNGDRARLALALALVAGLLASLHATVWNYPFMLDDYAFYEDASLAEPASLLLGSPSTNNYYRPLGRELYFAFGRALFGPNPAAFRVVNFALLIAIVLGVMALARRFGGTRAAVLSGAAFGVFGFHRVLLGWVSCAQDLLATLFGLAAVHLFLARRERRAGASLFAGLLAKASIASLPLALAGFLAWTRQPLRRATPLALAVVAWIALDLAVRAARGAWMTGADTLPIADATLAPTHAAEGARLALLSFVGLDAAWSDLAFAWARFQWPLLASAFVGALVLLAFTVRPKANDASLEPGGMKLALLWTLTGILLVALVGHHFSRYYVTFAAIGVALALGLALARAHVAVALPALLAFLALQAAPLGTRNYRIDLDDEAPLGTPIVSAARLDSTARQLRAFERTLRQAVEAPGTEVVTYRMTREIAIASAGERGPRVWLGDPTLTLTPQSGFAFDEGDDRPRAFVRFDAETGTFVELSECLAYSMVQGEVALERGKPDSARVWLDRAIACCEPGVHDLERAELSNTLGVAEAQAGDLVAAREAWEESLELEPDHDVALLNLARLDLVEGRLGEARERVLDILRRAPANEAARSLLTEIEREPSARPQD